ncbi:MAG: hypothetical protein AAGB14_08360 [Verrucomicrobiota bacterium]
MREGNEIASLAQRRVVMARSETVQCRGLRAGCEQKRLYFNAPFAPRLVGSVVVYSLVAWRQAESLRRFIPQSSRGEVSELGQQGPRHIIDGFELA